MRLTASKREDGEKEEGGSDTGARAGINSRQGAEKKGEGIHTTRKDKESVAQCHSCMRVNANGSMALMMSQVHPVTVPRMQSEVRPDMRIGIS